MEKSYFVVASLSSAASFSIRELRYTAGIQCLPGFLDEGNLCLSLPLKVSLYELERATIF